MTFKQAVNLIISSYFKRGCELKMIFFMIDLKNKAESCIARQQKNSLLMILSLAIATVAISGCSVNKPYAQNPFNPEARISDSATQNAGSDSRVSKAADLGLAAASRPIPGALPHGADIGISSALFLLSGGHKIPSEPINKNYVFVDMPLSMASDEEEAKIKLGSIVEKCIMLALPPDYQVKIEEYDDSYAFGRTLRPRWLRVNGPHCENWSCQIIAPIPTANALQWEGDVVRKNENWRYKNLPFVQSITLIKISREYDKDGVLAGRRHYVEGYELVDFDYQNFFRRVSLNLPKWAAIHWFPHGKEPQEMREGNVTPIS